MPDATDAISHPDGSPRVDQASSAANATDENLVGRVLHTRSTDYKSLADMFKGNEGRWELSLWGIPIIGSSAQRYLVNHVH